jgi:hypothetical protein
MSRQEESGEEMGEWRGSGRMEEWRGSGRMEEWRGSGRMEEWRGWESGRITNTLALAKAQNENQHSKVPLPLLASLLEFPLMAKCTSCKREWR